MRHIFDRGPRFARLGPACRSDGFKPLRTVVLGDRPVEVEEWLQRRSALGLDRFDEVWEGEYHVAPAAHGRHGDIDQQLAELLGPAARAVGLRCLGPVNIGTGNNYRVPDRSVVPPNRTGGGGGSLSNCWPAPGCASESSADHETTRRIASAKLTGCASPSASCTTKRTVPLHPMLVGLINDYRAWRGPTTTGVLVERDDHKPMDGLGLSHLDRRSAARLSVVVHLLFIPC